MREVVCNMMCGEKKRIVLSEEERVVKLGGQLAGELGKVKVKTLGR